MPDPLPTIEELLAEEEALNATEPPALAEPSTYAAALTPRSLTSRGRFAMLERLLTVLEDRLLHATSAADITAISTTIVRFHAELRAEEIHRDRRAPGPKSTQPESQAISPLDRGRQQAAALRQVG